jgi:hypothetical protein
MLAIDSQFPAVFLLDWRNGGVSGQAMGWCAKGD